MIDNRSVSYAHKGRPCAKASLRIVYHLVVGRYFVFNPGGCRLELSRRAVLNGRFSMLVGARWRTIRDRFDVTYRLVCRWRPSVRSGVTSSHVPRWHLRVFRFRPRRLEARAGLGKALAADFQRFVEVDGPRFAVVSTFAIVWYVYEGRLYAVA